MYIILPLGIEISIQESRFLIIISNFINHNYNNIKHIYVEKLSNYKLIYDLVYDRSINIVMITIMLTTI